MLTESAVSGSVELTARLASFLVFEASLLDKRRLREWLDLVTGDFVYRVPVPVTVDNPLEPSYDLGSTLVDEDRTSIEQNWIPRYEPGKIDYAWGENPPQRVRRYLSNFRIADHSGDVVTVESNLLVSFSRLDSAAVLVPAGRVDVIDCSGDEPLLQSRTVYFDETVMRLPHLHFIF